MGGRLWLICVLYEGIDIILVDDVATGQVVTVQFIEEAEQ